MTALSHAVVVTGRDAVAAPIDSGLYPRRSATRHTAHVSETTAWHEAGHAVARAVLGLPFRYVTIRPRSPGTLGNIAARPARRPGWALAVAAAAGPWAELRYLADESGDEDEAAWLVGLLGGCSGDEDDLDRLLTTGVWPYPQSPADVVEGLLGPMIGVVEAVASKLLASGTLQSADVARLVSVGQALG